MVIIGTFIAAVIVFGIPVYLRKQKNKKIIWSIMASYVVGILILTLGIRSYDDESTINLQFFHGLERIWFQLSNSFRKYGHRYDLQQLWMMRRGICNILLNVILFVPVGYLTPLTFKQVGKWYKMLAFGFGFTFCIEILQSLTHRGWFDVDDLVLNTFGAMLGWALYRKKLVENVET